MSLLPLSLSTVANILYLLCIQSLPQASAQLTSTGSTLVLDGVSYYVPAAPFANVEHDFKASLLSAKTSAAGLVPVTVVSGVGANFSQSDLEKMLGVFGGDDVWGGGFLAVLLIQYMASEEHAQKQRLSANASSVSSLSAPSTIPPGPYFIHPEGALYQPYRLYSDFAGAFTQPLMPAGNDSYAPLPASIAGIDSPTVGVPSRLYYTKTAAKPLAGVRLGVKDIYDVAGVKTGDGNRAYYGLYPPRTANAVAVQKLIDAGAIIIGKMKTSQFANGETATADWVDYHSPFNPRGDGYQDPSSSSSGPGAGEGSYPWLDLTIGSDTGGSIRGPSQVQGLFGNRPSHGLVPLTGVMPLAPELDTAGFLTRDPVIWAAAGKALYDGLPFYTKYPKKIYTLSFPKASSAAPADVLALGFLSNLQAFLSANVTVFNTTAAWAATRPAGADPNLNDLLNITYPILISKEQTKLVRAPFFADYAAAHDGRKPFVDPVPLVRWAYGDAYPDSALQQAITNKTIFMDWWNTRVLVNDSVTCSNSLLLYTAGAQTQYRNQYLPTPGVPYGFGTSRISVLAEVPDVVVPIGQSPYNSTITSHTEYLPVTVDILAAKGCDGMIFNLVLALEKAGIVKASLAGGTINGGEVLLRRGE